MEASDLENLVLESKYPEFQYMIKGPRHTVWRDGYPIQEPKHIPIFFSRFLCELNDMARDQEWTDEDKLYVAKAIETAFNDPKFVDMWVHERAKPGKPWPTYDETHHNQVPVVASSVGLVAEALTYEREGRPGGPRESVVKKLEELLSDGVENENLVDELAAA